MEQHGWSIGRVLAIISILSIKKQQVSQSDSQFSILDSRQLGMRKV